jgi:hypothetical protein
MTDIIILHHYDSTGKPVDVVELWEACLSSDAFGS